MHTSVCLFKWQNILHSRITQVRILHRSLFDFCLFNLKKMKGVVELRYFGQSIPIKSGGSLVQLQLLQAIAAIAQGYKSSFVFYPFNCNIKSVVCK